MHGFFSYRDFFFYYISNEEVSSLGFTKSVFSFYTRRLSPNGTVDFNRTNRRLFFFSFFFLVSFRLLFFSSFSKIFERRFARGVRTSPTLPSTIYIYISLLTLRENILVSKVFCTVLSPSSKVMMLGPYD